MIKNFIFYYFSWRLANIRKTLYKGLLSSLYLSLINSDTNIPIRKLRNSKFYVEYRKHLQFVEALDSYSPAQSENIFTTWIDLKDD